MVLGERFETDHDVSHLMLGFLPVTTSFAQCEMQLGYRKVKTVATSLLGKKGTAYLGHEFHYATDSVEADVQPLFQVSNAAGRALGTMGVVVKSVFGSFIHLIDCTG